jgi:hypothetical protein
MTFCHSKFLFDLVSPNKKPRSCPQLRVPFHLAHVWNSRWKIAKRSVSINFFFSFGRFSVFLGLTTSRRIWGRRSRPKGKPRFEPFENCVFRVAQTWLNGIFPSPREFCGQLKRNQLYILPRRELLFRLNLKEAKERGKFLVQNITDLFRYWRMQNKNNCSSSDRFITVQCRI